VCESTQDESAAIGDPAGATLEAAAPATVLR